MPVEFALNITDYNGALYVNENHATAELTVMDKAPGKAVRLFGNKSFASQGSIYFPGLVVIADPGSTIVLQLTIDEVGSASYFSQSQHTITVILRECVPGE